MPNITSTPSASRERRIASEPSILVIDPAPDSCDARASRQPSETSNQTRRVALSLGHLLEVLGIGAGGGQVGDDGVGERPGVEHGSFFGSGDRALQRSEERRVGKE